MIFSELLLLLWRGRIVLLPSWRWRDALLLRGWRGREAVLLGSRRARVALRGRWILRLLLTLRRWWRIIGRLVLVAVSDLNR